MAEVCRIECPLFVEDIHDQEAMKAALDNFKESLEDFEQLHGVSLEWSELDTADLIKAFSRDLKKMRDIDQIIPGSYRIAGLITFWIRKLRPLWKVEVGGDDPIYADKFERYRNEIFSLHLGLSYVVTGGRLMLGADDQPFIISPREISEIIDTRFSELLYDLRYRAISPQAMAAIFKQTVPYHRGP